MVGYHYTSWDNWLKIQVEGLRPSRVTHPRFQRADGVPIYVIWAWLEKVSGIQHLGQLLWTMGKHRTFRVVRISFDFDEADVHAFDQVFHHGSLYPRPMALVESTIPPHNIHVEY